MAFVQPHTANLTPHPAPVAPLADRVAERGVGSWFTLAVCLSAIADRYSDAGACADSRFKNQESVNVISRRVAHTCLALCLAGKTKGLAKLLLSL